MYGNVWKCTVWRFGLCTHPSFQGEVSHNQNVSASATAVVHVLPFQASNAESTAPRMATLRALLLATFLGQESRSSMGRGLERSHSASHGPSRAFFKTQTGFVLRISELFWAALLCHWFLSRSFSPCCISLVLLRKAKATMRWLAGGFFARIGPGGFLEHLLGCQVRWVFVRCLHLEQLLWSTAVGWGLVRGLFYPIYRELSFTMVEIPLTNQYHMEQFP